MPAASWSVGVKKVENRPHSGTLQEYTEYDNTSYDDASPGYKSTSEYVEQPENRGDSFR